MSNLKKLAALLLCFAFMLTFFATTFATDEIEFEEIESYIGEPETEEEETEYIVYFNDDVVTLYSDEGKDYALMNKEELDAAIEEGVVEFYEENSFVYLYGDIDPKQIGRKWDVNMINANYAYNLGYTGKDVKIAVIDSGCNFTGDLTTNNVLAGYNIPENSTDVTDDIGHGTMVSAQIAAEANAVGFRGVAPDAKIVPIKIFEEKKAKVSLVSDAIKLAVDDYDCDIINMSLGGSEDSETLRAAVEYAASKNVLMIAAVGNNGTDSYSYPAAYEEVIAVGAVDHKKRICSYSQHNDAVDVCAPGGRESTDAEKQKQTDNDNDDSNEESGNKTKDDPAKIACLAPSGVYYTAFGTSFAAPLVTGVAAIFRGLDSDFTKEEFYEIIKATSVDLGNAGYDTYYGYGLVDIREYLEYYFAPMGDNNVDGKVTSEDAKRIADYVIGSFSSFVKESAADVNEDGVINLLDAILVARNADGWDGYDLPYNK